MKIFDVWPSQKFWLLCFGLCSKMVKKGTFQWRFLAVNNALNKKWYKIRTLTHLIHILLGKKNWKIGQYTVEKWLFFAKHSIWAKSAKSMRCLNVMKNVYNQFENKILWIICLVRKIFYFIEFFYLWSKKIDFIK